MTLNGVMAVILCYFTEFGRFWVSCLKVSEDRSVLVATKIVIQII